MSQSPPNNPTNVNDVMIITVDVQKLERLKLTHVRFILLDVRSKERFEAEHIFGAFHAPADSPSDFTNHLARSIPDKQMPVVIYDEDGAGLPPLLLLAEQLGFLNVVGLEGGFTAWQSRPKTPGLY